jgi:hypothetical protein
MLATLEVPRPPCIAWRLRKITRYDLNNFMSRVHELLGPKQSLRKL